MSWGTAHGLLLLTGICFAEKTFNYTTCASGGTRDTGGAAMRQAGSLAGCIACRWTSAA